MFLCTTQSLAYVIIEFEFGCGNKPDDRYTYLDDIVLNGENDGTKWPIVNWLVCNTSTKFDLSVLLYEDYLRQEKDLENFVYRTLPKQTCVNVIRTQDVKVKAIEKDILTGQVAKEKVVVWLANLSCSAGAGRRILTSDWSTSSR